MVLPQPVLPLTSTTWWASLADTTSTALLAMGRQTRSSIRCEGGGGGGGGGRGGRGSIITRGWVGGGGDKAAVVVPGAEQSRSVFVGTARGRGPHSRATIAPPTHTTKESKDRLPLL